MPLVEIPAFPLFFESALYYKGFYIWVYLYTVVLVGEARRLDTVAIRIPFWGAIWQIRGAFLLDLSCTWQCYHSSLLANLIDNPRSLMIIVPAGLQIPDIGIKRLWSTTTFWIFIEAAYTWFSMCIIDYIEGNTPKQCIGTWIEVLKLLLLL